MEALMDIFDCSWKYGNKKVEEELTQNVRDAWFEYCDEESIKFYLLHVEDIEIIAQGNYNVILNVNFRHDVDINDVYEFISLTTELIYTVFHKKVQYFYYSRPRDLKHKERLLNIRSKYREKRKLEKLKV